MRQGVAPKGPYDIYRGEGCGTNHPLFQTRDSNRKFQEKPRKTSASDEYFALSDRRPEMKVVEALLLAASLTFSTPALAAGPAPRGRQLPPQTVAPFDPTDMPFDPTVAVPFDLSTAGPANSTWLVQDKQESANHSGGNPGWHGDRISLQMRRQVVHLLIGVGSGLLLAVLLIICIICLLSRFCAAPEPIAMTTEFCPERDGRRSNQGGGRALSMPEVIPRGASPNTLKVTMSCPPIQETV
ncbi:Hypp7571 [Branchiostoma lanceolatum]|uniref:Hypp7571 protein n=1 Tax=Branchiostoma lanceolatum TaxID=7740 RepID=A0A8J9Z2D8_BRALA|nr:Hypp7571 [Branchiostoma lanceolatum]